MSIEQTIIVVVIAAYWAYATWILRRVYGGGYRLLAHIYVALSMLATIGLLAGAFFGTQ